MKAQKANYDGWLPTLITPSQDFDAATLRFGASYTFSPDDSEQTNSTTTFQGFDGYADSATLSGFWALNRWHFEKWEEDGSLSDGIEDEYTLHAYYSNEEPPVTAMGVSFPGVSDHLWLMRDDLVKLHQHINSGAPFDITPENEAERAADPGGKQIKARKVMNSHLETIALLSRLISDSDKLSAKRQFDIISAGLASRGWEQLPVDERQFRTWLSNGRVDLDDT
ncbi:hypothetical protein D3C85_725730 [compost metagenome]